MSLWPIRVTHWSVTGDINLLSPCPKIIEESFRTYKLRNCKRRPVLCFIFLPNMKHGQFRYFWMYQEYCGCFVIGKLMQNITKSLCILWSKMYVLRPKTYVLRSKVYVLRPKMYQRPTKSGQFCSFVFCEIRNTASFKIFVRFKNIAF